MGRNEVNTGKTAGMNGKNKHLIFSNGKVNSTSKTI
jgi:hypothetical protein